MNSLDEYLAEKLNPNSRSHELPARGDFWGARASADGFLYDYRYEPKLKLAPNLPQFNKYRDLFFEKSQERANHTGGITLVRALHHHRRCCCHRRW